MPVIFNNICCLNTLYITINWEKSSSASPGHQGKIIDSKFDFNPDLQGDFEAQINITIILINLLLIY